MLPAWGEVCRAFTESGYPALGHADYIGRAPAERPAQVALIRHDVELRPRHAVRLAELERSLGLVATYFFRGRGLSFHPAAIAAVHALGHEVGYHYDTLARARGDMDRALDLFREDLERLRALGPVRVASMHGSPLLPWDNRELWRRAAPSDFGLTGEVYRDIDYAEVAYFSDTGRTWHPTRFNVRDHAPGERRHTPSSTSDLVALIRSRELPRICVLAHPERWPSTLVGWALQGALDTAANHVKLGLAWLYSGVRRPA